MKETVLRIINEIRQAKGLSVLTSIKEEDSLRGDLELTSFDLAELTVKIEDEYDIDIFEDGLVNTVVEIFDKLGSLCCSFMTMEGNINMKIY